MPNRVRLDPGRVRGIGQGPFHQFGAHVIIDRPADDLLRIVVDDRGRVGEALSSVDIRHICHELDARPVGGEVPLNQFRHGRCRFGVSNGGGPEGPGLARHQVLLPHDLAHQLR